MTTDIITIADLVESVRLARADRARFHDEIKSRRAEFDERIQPVRDLLDEADEAVQETERQLRAAVLAEFKATGSKHPHPAVTIRQGKDEIVCEYPQIEALKYALEKGVALQLDAGLFETYMQALPEPSRPAWFHVRVTTPEPTAAIAKEIPAPEVKEETL